MLAKQIAGKLGEDHAVIFLKKNGFKIIDRNFRIRGGEIDIVAIDRSINSGQEALVFIEVKTRKTDEFGTPLESITPWKMRALIKAAEFYKSTHKNLPDLMRIDAVAVVLNPDNSIFSINLVKNIS